MISVVIPSYNSSRTIEGCLDALLNQSFGGAFEITLVDSSTDPTPRIVAERYPRIRLIHLGKKTDPGAARNVGIRASEGEIIAFTDSDCVVSHDWLERMVAAHQSDYAAVGGAVRNGNPHHDLIAWAGYLAEFREFIPEQARGETLHIPTCNISYKRTVFDTCGLFPGEYYPQEDLVFNQRIRQSGRRILFEPSIQVAHHHRSELRGFLIHQKRIGAITATVLPLFPLPGSWLLRSQILAWMTLPLLPAIKFCRTLAVFMKLQPHTVLRRPFVLLPFILGLVWWAAGFARGLGQSTSGQHVGALSHEPVGTASPGMPGDTKAR